jgi:nucleotide-binding universal stress UspA family protein
VIILKKILLPIERIDSKYEIITEAVKIAKKFDSLIVVFHVKNKETLLKDFDNISSESKELKSEFKAAVNKKVVTKEELIEKDIDSESFIDDVLKMYQEEGINVESKEAKGDPASKILDESEEGDYDVIIMKTHELKSNKRFLLGSVTNKVVHNAKIPVLVIR